jgi:hypothetical protein
MKAYFVDNELENVYELSASKRKKLEQKHPEWYSYNCELDEKQFNEVFEFFKKNGKLVASRALSNVFVGLTV